MFAQHADDFEVLRADADALADGIAEAEQLTRERPAEDAHRRGLLLVRRRQEPAALDRQSENGLIRGANAEHPRHRRRFRPPDAQVSLDERRGRAHQRHQRRQPIRVAGGEAVRRAGGAGRRLVARDQVVETERLHLIERFAACALAHRHHRDDRGHTENDAEHAQRRAQLVARERFGGNLQELPEFSEAGGHGSRGLRRRDRAGAGRRGCRGSGSAAIDPAVRECAGERADARHASGETQIGKHCELIMRHARAD